MTWDGRVCIFRRMTYYTLTYGASSSFVTAAQIDRELRRVRSVFPDRVVVVRKGWVF